MRISHGFDAHKFGGEGPIIIGGVAIEHQCGLLAHSDGDVLLHALCDALLGAAALGDIGRHFSDQSAEFKGISSRTLLTRVVDMISRKGYTINNVDMTIVAQAPKMAVHIEQMVVNIASDCRIETSAVNVKATTTEKMGYVGREEGIAAHAVTVIRATE
ncbi:MAG: 2-C-methyl-D-erythritol 2,4-cyclodiphosphate synthase [Kangiellaceae bacterium]|jgi:2-C-methyl-D-erythritol 2,4-cyclodiphosphate synthase|nr:2-C-methyl-D-erythritol 2,4-cyclodiphosphate synthase [Kangiellaceae bacterium]